MEHVELELRSEVYKFHGRCDALMKDKKGRMIVVDFKTGSLNLWKASMQVAAYALAWNEMNGFKADNIKYCKDGAVVHVDFNRDKMAVTVMEYQVPNMEAVTLAFQARLAYKILEREGLLVAMSIKR